MAHEDDAVIFNVMCGKCHRALTPRGAGLLEHDNNEDCDAGDITVPVVTPDDLSALFAKKPAKKATAKKTAKK